MDEPARKRHRAEKETQEGESGHTSLPPELWLVVVQHVTPKDILLGLSPCCSFFSRLFRSNLLWQHQLAVHYPEKVSIYKEKDQGDEWLGFLKREALLNKNWQRGIFKASVLNPDAARVQKEQKNQRRIFGRSETIEDLDLCGGFLATFSVSSEVAIYQASPPYSQLYSFLSNSSSYLRRKRVSIAHLGGNELSLVVIGAKIELWKVILPHGEAKGSHQVLDTIPPYPQGEWVSDFVLDMSEDPPVGAFSCYEGVIVARIHKDKMEVLWKSHMCPAPPAKDNDGSDSSDDEDEQPFVDELMGSKYDYITNIAMNKSVVVLGADSGVIRVFDRSKGERVHVTSINTSGWSRNSPHRMALHGDYLAVISISIEGGGRSDTAATLFIIKMINSNTNSFEFRWRTTTLRRPEVDAQSFGLYIDAKRIVASMEIVRVWPGWADEGANLFLGPQLKIGAVPLPEADAVDDESINPFESKPIGLGLGQPSWDRFSWEPYNSRALWVDNARIITGDACGVLRMWSFEPQDGL